MSINLYKKILTFASLILLLIGVFTPQYSSFAQIAEPCVYPDVSIGGVCVHDPKAPQCPPGQALMNGECEIINTNPNPSPVSPGSYQFLAPITTSGGGTGPSFNPAQPNAFGVYLNTMIKIFIGLCAVAGVIMIIAGGIEYMTSELMHSKEHGKERIMGALLGLLIAMGSYAILNTINPDLLKSDVVIPETTIAATRQIQVYSGQGQCVPISNPSNPCAPGGLSAFGSEATHASAICNGESTGDPNLASGVDKCSDGSSFSFGLFQVNAIAHADEIAGGVCSGVFRVNSGGTQGACLEQNKGVCVKHDCQVIDPAQYQTCQNYLTNPSNNIAFAANLLKQRNWNQWGANNSCHY